MTIPDELVEIGAGPLHARYTQILDVEYGGAVREVITAILPEIAKMMLEPSDKVLDALVRETPSPYELSGEDGIAYAQQWRAGTSAFFKERFGIEIDKG